MNDQIDPRKKYLTNSRIDCRNLSVTQKQYINVCKKELGDIVIKPKPSPSPSPKPKPKPPRPPVPPVPPRYEFSIPSYITDPRQSELLRDVGIAGGIGGSLVLADYATRRRLSDFRIASQGYRRVPTADPRMESEFTTATEDVRGAGLARGRGLALGGEVEMGQLPRGRALAPITYAEPALQATPEELTDVPLQDTAQQIGLRRRLGAVRQPLEPMPPRTPRPTVTSFPAGTIRQSAQELSEAEQSRTALMANIDNLVTQSRQLQQATSTLSGAVDSAESAEEFATTAQQATEAVAEAEPSLIRQSRITAVEAETGVEVAEEAGQVGEATEVAGEAEEAGEATEEAGEAEQAGEARGAEGSIFDIAGPLLDNIFVPSMIIGGITATTIGSWNFRQGTNVLSDVGKRQMIDNIESQIKTATGATKTNLIAFQSRLQQSLNNNSQAVEFTNEDNKQDIAFQLSKPEIANAIKVYQQNPNVFKGVSPLKLQIMGLNPAMSQGQAGAVETSIGYVPKTRTSDGATWTSGAGGGNWSNFYLSKINSGKSMFGSNQDITNSATPVSQSDYAQDYINEVQSIAKNEKDPQTLAYLNYQINLTKYQLGELKTEPKPVAQPPKTSQAMVQLEKATQMLKAKQSALTAVKNSIATKQSALSHLNSQINTLEAQNQNAQPTTNQIIATQQNYNQQISQQVNLEAGQDAERNIQLARITNHPLLVPTGKYLTTSQMTQLQSQLQSQQVGTNKIVTVTPTGITTTKQGSPVISQTALQTVSTAPTPPKTTPTN